MNCFLRPVRRSSCDSLDRSSPVTSAVGSYCVSVKTKPSETIVPEVPFAGDGVSTWRTCASTMVCLETGEHLFASFAGVEEGESFPLVTAMDCDCVVVASAPATASRSSGSQTANRLRVYLADLRFHNGLFGNWRTFVREFRGC